MNHHNRQIGIHFSSDNATIVANYHLILGANATNTNDMSRLINDTTSAHKVLILITNLKRVAMQP